MWNPPFPGLGGVLEGQALSCLIPATSLPFSLCTPTLCTHPHLSPVRASLYAVVLPPQDLGTCCFLGLELSLFPHNVFFSGSTEASYSKGSLSWSWTQFVSRPQPTVNHRNEKNCTSLGNHSKPHPSPSLLYFEGPMSSGMSRDSWVPGRESVSWKTLQVS